MSKCVSFSAGRPKRPALTLARSGLLAVAALALLPAEAQAQASPQAVEAAIKSADANNKEVRAFYKARGNRPLWIRGSWLGPEADRFLELIMTADADGLDPNKYRPHALAEAIDRARDGSPKALARAEMLLSRRFAEYVRDVRQPRDVGMIYVDKELAPTVPTVRQALEAAAAAPSLLNYVETMGWMNPVYGQLRKAVAAHRSGRAVTALIPYGALLKPGATGERVRLLRMRLGLDPEGPYDRAVADAVREFQESRGLPVDGVAGPRTLAALNAGGGNEQHILRVNLERARALPANPGRRYVLVDAAAARLWLYEDGRVRDSMRVVVGKPDQPTPMMAGLIRYTVVNPYWNIPPDLVRERIAPNVLREGTSYLENKGYEVLSDWTENARTVDPEEVDWQAVASGRQELRVRQLPGRDNAMGKMKFMFPNEQGVYLHDTPDKELLRERDRRFSAGCVRVEDAQRLARWLYGKPLPIRSGAREQQVPLSNPVPVYITYLTAAPEGGRIAFREDPYNRDRAQLARLAAGGFGSR